MLVWFANSLIFLVNSICSILYIILVVRILISWVNADPYNEIVRMVYSVTDPILAPLKRLPLRLGMLDLSPIVAFMLLKLIQTALLGLIYAIF